MMMGSFVRELWKNLRTNKQSYEPTNENTCQNDNLASNKSISYLTESDKLYSIDVAT